MVAYDDKFKVILRDLISEDPVKAEPALEFMTTQDIDVYEPLFLAMQDSDSNLRQAAAVASLTLPYPLGAGLTPALRVCLDDPQPEVRIAAAQGLRDNSPEQSDVDRSFQTVVELLSNDNCVAYAVSLLKTFPRVKEEAPLALLELLNDKDPDMAISAADAIAWVFPQSIERALTLLQNLLKAPLSETRCKAALTLADIRKPAAPAVSSLIEIIDDEDSAVRCSVLRALGSILSHQSQVIPAIVQCLEDPNEDVQAVAALALGRFEDDAIPAIISSLQGQEPTIDILLLVALTEAGVDVMENVLAQLESESNEPASPLFLESLRRKIESEVRQPEDESELPGIVIVYRRMDQWLQKWERSIGALIILIFITALLCLFGWAAR
ncbi:MAG: HEAT repeat domain-containing protein [Planctomycetota bacterium]|nr:HEAT repeat domain-containing protein [Planctomycetota bacterium]